MFGPRYGILEESGTGMAAGPLSCYLYDILKIKKSIFKIQQGKFMEEYIGNKKAVCFEKFIIKSQTLISAKMALAAKNIRVFRKQ